MEHRAMNKGVANHRIADLDVAVDGALDPNPAVGQAAELDLDGVGIAVGVGAEADPRRALAPTRLFAVLEPARRGCVDDSVLDGDGALPRGPAIPVANPSAPPRNRSRRVE
jgi:hypothetical protein